MIRFVVPERATHALAGGLLLTVILAPWGAALAKTHAVSQSSAKVPVTSSSWQAVMATRAGTGTIGMPLSLLAAAWSGGHTFPAPIGKTDASVAVDAVNVGTEALMAQEYVLTITQFDNTRSVNLWLCAGSVWAAQKCAGGTVVQIGSTQVVSANGDYIFQTGTGNASFVVQPGARLSLLITSTQSGKPTKTELVGVIVSRSQSVRLGGESDS